MASEADKAIVRKELKDLMQRAGLEIQSSMTRIENMGDFELSELKGAANALRAFFDFNGVCGSESVGTVNTPIAVTRFQTPANRVAPLREIAKPGNGTQGFFDFNGVC